MDPGRDMRSLAPGAGGPRAKLKQRPTCNGLGFRQKTAMKARCCRDADFFLGVKSMRIAMIGAGYVGLVTGACLADFGHEVVCVDNDEDKVVALRAGRVPIYEPGLSELVQANRSAGRLFFTTKLKEAARGARAIFIAVGTPSLAEVGSADMHYVHEAARAIAEAIEDFTGVVVKSTVPIGAGDAVERILAERAPRDR